jgi:calcineurin-like phosphoesterase family protein
MIVLRDSFPKKYKVLVGRELTDDHPAVMYWVDNNSKGDVSVQIFRVLNHNGEKVLMKDWPPGDSAVRRVGKRTAYFGFEDESDALIFKIKFI